MPVACFAVPQFALACERARLPHLWEEPVALASAEGLLQIVSDEAIRYGVRAGQTASAARSLCAPLVVLPYDRPAYETAAQLLWDLFAVESSVVEPFSPEICFVEMTGRDVLRRVQELAAALSTRVTVPVQVGLASGKFVARQAALQPGGTPVLVVPIGQEASFLAPLPVEHAPGIDHRVKQRLHRLGVRTLGDIARLPPGLLQRQMREMGLVLHRLSHGKDGDRVRPLWPPRRIEKALQFEDEVCEEAAVYEALRRLALRIAEELGQEREFCRALALTIGLLDGAYLQERERLAVPLDRPEELLRAALRLLRRLQPDQPLLEVILRASDLGSGGGVQLALLDENEHGRGLPHERRARLEATLSYLRRRFPVGAPVLCSLLRQARRVGLWTYPLGHLLALPVQVKTTREGAPLSYHGRRYRRVFQGEVRRIYTHWRETEWHWDRLLERTVWRVETDPAGFCELQQMDIEWRLGAVAD